MELIPTMRIKGPQGPIIINIGDFDVATMERWEEPAAPSAPPEDAPGAGVEGVSDLGESVRRRPSRG